MIRLARRGSDRIVAVRNLGRRASSVDGDARPQLRAVCRCSSMVVVVIVVVIAAVAASAAIGVAAFGRRVEALGCRRRAKE
jgi:hypothetical protein